MGSNHTVPLVIVDSANVVGSVPDGWWNDRVGANTRLRDSLQVLCETGLQDLPGPVDVILVVEGEARHLESIEGVRVESAGHDIGDNRIVELVKLQASRRVVVITSDGELQARVTHLGAEVQKAKTIPRPTFKRFAKRGTNMFKRRGNKSTTVARPRAKDEDSVQQHKGKGIKRKAEAMDSSTMDSKGPSKTLLSDIAGLTRRQRKRRNYKLARALRRQNPPSPGVKEIEGAPQNSKQHNPLQES